MTAAQRRSVTVLISETEVTITTEVTDYHEVTAEAERLYNATRPPQEPKQQIGFGSQIVQARHQPNMGGPNFYEYGPIEAREQQ